MASFLLCPRSWRGLGLKHEMCGFPARESYTLLYEAYALGSLRFQVAFFSKSCLKLRWVEKVLSTCS